MKSPSECERNRTKLDWVLLGLVVAEAILWLSERFQWTELNRSHKGWSVLITLGTLGVTLAFLLLWFAVAMALRQRPKFDVRSLLLLTLVLAVPCSWLGFEIRQAKRQQEAIAAISELGAGVVYDTDLPLDRPFLMRLLGDDFFTRVYCVVVSGADCRGPDVFAHLAQLPEITELTVHQSQLTDACLENLRGLKRLRHLELCETRITGAGLARLAALPELRRINLEGTPITDADLENLKGMTRLEALGLAKTNVTNAGLRHIEGLVNLRVLDLSDSKVTPEALKELQRVLPRCIFSPWIVN